MLASSIENRSIKKIDKTAVMELKPAMVTA